MSHHAFSLAINAATVALSAYWWGSNRRVGRGYGLNAFLCGWSLAVISALLFP